MFRRQKDLEMLRHVCKQRFRGARTGCCPYCGTVIKHDMARHVASFHLDLALLWQCPVSWCTQWKGTPQDCIDHIRKKHSVPDSVKAVNLGRWFPPWTVTREAWHKALKPQVPGISTDVMLFSEHGLPLVHHYLVLSRSAAHGSLRGTFMNKFRVFIIRADAKAKWEVGHGPNTTTRLPPSSDSLTPLPRSIRPIATRGSDYGFSGLQSPLMRTASSRIVSSVTFYVGTATSSDYPVPKPCSTLYSGLPPILPVSIPLPRFADKNFVPIQSGLRW